MDTSTGQMRKVVASELAEDEILINPEAARLLNEIAPENRIKFLAQSTDPRLKEAKDSLRRHTANKLRILLTIKKIGRNEPCLCGSGKKYKKCCLNKIPDMLEKEISKEGLVLDSLTEIHEKMSKELDG